MFHPRSVVLPILITTAVVLGALVPASGVNAAAAIQLAQSQVGPGGTLTVSGQGYQPGTTVVVDTTVKAGGYSTPLSTATSAAVTGTFTAQVALPGNTDPGTYDVTAHDPQGNTATVSYQVIPLVTFVAGQGQATMNVSPGEQITFNGSGFRPGEIVDITAPFPLTDGSVNTQTSPVQTSAQGTFSGVTLTVPTNARQGTVVVTARGTASGASSTVTLNVANQAHITLSPSTASPGQTVTVNGQGFAPNAQVTLSITIPRTNSVSDTFSQTVTAAANGTFSAPLTLASDLVPGTYTVTAASTANNVSTTAQLTITAQPAIKLQPTSVRPGQTVTVTGQGFPVSSQVVVSVTIPRTTNAAPTVTQIVTSTASGTFTAQLPLGADVIPGTYTVTARSATSNVSASSTLTVAANPTLAVQPATALPGQSVTVTGNGFVAGTPVTIAAVLILTTGGTQTVSATATPATTGSFTAALTIPANAASGPATITATQGQQTVTTGLTVGLAQFHISVTPSSAIPGSSITVQGDGFPSGDRVSVSVPVHLTTGAPSTLTASATATPAGTFSVPLSIPLTVASGAYTVTVQSAATGRSVTAQLAVPQFSPTLSVAPSTGAPGSQVIVNGSGFAPGSSVTISLDGSTLTTATVNGAGQFSIPATIPATAPGGTGTITAQDQAGRKATAGFTVQRAVSTHFYFASLYTGTNYHEYIALLNATQTPASVTITYERTTGTTLTRTLTVKANTRATEDVNADLGADVSAGAVVSADVPISASRVVYYGSDGAVDPGTTNPATQWYFANGNTSHGYREYIAVENPNTTALPISVRFLPTHHAAFTLHRMMPPTSRTTIQVSAYVPRDAVGVIVSASLPIVANRTIYEGTGMTSKTGVSQMNASWYFGSGPNGNRAHNWLAVINPSDQPANLTMQIIGRDGTPLRTLVAALQPYARVGYLMNRLVQRSDVSAILQSSVPVVAEQTTYVARGSRALTDIFGDTAPATTWQFANASTGPGQSDILTLFNPGSATISVAVNIFTTGGQVTHRTYELTPMAQFHVSVGSLVPSGQLGLQTTSTSPFIALNRYWFAAHHGAMTSSGFSG